MIVVTSRKGFLITGFFILLLGIGLIVGGFVYRSSTNEKLENWTHVNATVTGYVSRSEEDSDGYKEYKYYATVEYYVNGARYKSTGGASSRIPPTKGTSREIAYNPENPSECIFVEDTTDFITVFLCVCGGAFVFAGILVFVTYGIKKR